MTQLQQSRVESILAAIAAPPNRRERPVDGDVEGEFDFWFDGGACSYVTGSTHYEFADGATASIPVVPDAQVRITLPDGETFHVKPRS